MSADRVAEERLVEAMADALWRSSSRFGGGLTYQPESVSLARALLAGPVGSALAAARREALEDTADVLDGKRWRPDYTVSWLRHRAAGVER